MNIRTSLKSNKYKLIFIGVLFLIGIFFGIIIFFKQPNIIKENISLQLELFTQVITSNRVNQLLYHLIILIILFILNFTVIGFLGTIFYLFYEGCSFGFSVAIFTYKYKLSGLLFSILFNIVTKFCFLLLLMYVSYKGITVIKRVIGSIVLKQNDITYLFIKRNLTVLSIIISISLISDILLYAVGSKVVQLFLFLL